jgi:predicted phage terminase large subunit-like protein
MKLDAWADDYAGALYRLARDDFGIFRQLIHPEMLWNWWTDEVARKLGRFYQDLKEGRRPKLALMAPPQHGKTTTIVDFIAWIAGKDPELRTIYASYSDELGIAANRQLFRVLTGTTFRKIFPGVEVGAAGWAANNSLIEFVRHRGLFRNTTVEGVINGFGLDLGVIDDPVKGHAEAISKVQRENTWEWFTQDFFNRFARDAGLLTIMTRWHVDDVLGRMLERFGDGLRVLRYPAVAETTSWRWKKELITGEDGRRRFVWQKQLVREGEALFAEHKPLSFLDERRKVMSQAAWQALYQQHPIVVGGGELPIEKIRVVPSWNRADVRHSVRYIDKAGTPGGGAYTAGVLMHKMADNTYVISHIMRGQWSALEREQKIKTIVAEDAEHYPNYQVVVEQEPGSGGKESVEHTIRNLAGYRVSADRVTGPKEVRVQPFAAQVQAGNIGLVADGWVRSFLDECETWPKGKFSDQVDAAAGAFSKLTSSTYDSTYSGFDVDWQRLARNCYVWTAGGFSPWPNG